MWNLRIKLNLNDLCNRGGLQKVFSNKVNYLGSRLEYFYYIRAYNNFCCQNIIINNKTISYREIEYRKKFYIRFSPNFVFVIQNEFIR